MYYAVDASRRATYACSRLAPLVLLLGAALHLDVQRLAAHLLFGDSAEPDATVFRQIKRVLPGETLIFEAGRVTRGSRAELHARDGAPRSTDEWASDLRMEIERAVARATAAHRRIAVLASGGLDSSALLAALVRPKHGSRGAAIEDVVALTLDFDASPSDRPYFASIVDTLGVEAVRISPEECAHNAFAAMVIDGAPRPWPTNALDVEILSVARARGADCVLTGIGGDFFWDMEIAGFGELAARGRFLAAIRGALELEAAYWLPTKWGRIRDLVLRPFVRSTALSLLPASVRPMVRRARVRRAVRYPDWAGPALRSYVLGRADRIFESADYEITRAARMSALARSSSLADGADGMAQVETSAGAVETHVFFDVGLARFLASIPSSVTLADGWLRGILRRAFRDAWPRAILERADKGMFAPAMKIANDGLRASGALDKLFEMSALGDLGLVEPRKVRAAFADAHRAGGDLTDLWPMLTCEAFASGLAPTSQVGFGGS